MLPIIDIEMQHCETAAVWVCRLFCATFEVTAHGHIEMCILLLLLLFLLLLFF